MGGIAGAIVVAIIVAACSGGHDLYGQSDSPLFLAVSKRPFGNGVPFPGKPLVQGVAYRYGRIGFPFVGWLLALGRPSAARWSLTTVYVASFGAWIAFAAEHLRRGGRNPRLALWVFATPWALLWFVLPDVVSEPMAGALVLLAYLYERRGSHRSVRIVAAFAILTRELMVVAFIPIAWRDWKERRWLAVRDWAFVGAPYLLWITWVRFRVGQFPFADPARRDAMTTPVVGWIRPLAAPLDNGQPWGLLIGAVTIAVAVLIAIRGNWVYPVTHGALALAALSLCYGVAVFDFPGEAIRVMAPTQLLLLIAAFDRSGQLISSSTATSRSMALSPGEP